MARVFESSSIKCDLVRGVFAVFFLISNHAMISGYM
jgi:hypothetical protein